MIKNFAYKMEFLVKMWFFRCSAPPGTKELQDALQNELDS